MDQDIWRRLLNLEHCDPVSDNDLRAIRAAVDEIERLRRPSWDDLMAIVDEIYPADVFDGSSGDEGPRTLTLMREIERLRSLITEWADATDLASACMCCDQERFASAEQALRRAVGR